MKQKCCWASVFLYKKTGYNIFLLKKQHWFQQCFLSSCPIFQKEKLLVLVSQKKKKNKKKIKDANLKKRTQK